MAYLSEFERKAWDSREDAVKHRPEMALKAVLDDMESGKINTRHVVVVFVEENEENETDVVSYYQAGDLPTLSVSGVLTRAMVMSSRV